MHRRRTPLPPGGWPTNTESGIPDISPEVMVAKAFTIVIQ